MLAYNTFKRIICYVLILQFGFIIICLNKFLNISNSHSSEDFLGYPSIRKEHISKHNLTVLHVESLLTTPMLTMELNKPKPGKITRTLNATERRKYEIIHCPKINQTIDSYFESYKGCVDKQSNISSYNGFLISHKNICDAKQNLFLLILIHSYHSYIEKRMAIRETWGSISLSGKYPGYQKLFPEIVLLFVLGEHTEETKNKAVRIENDEYGDIIQGDFKESYKNLTLKHLFGLQFAVEYCSNAQYIIKMDDDIILNMPVIIRYLQIGIPPNTIVGPVNTNARVDRQKKSKWFLTCSEYPLSHFPCYVSGAAYILDIPIARKLLKATPCVPVIHLDDTYVTGFLAKIMDIDHHNPGGFTFLDFIKTPNVTFCDTGRFQETGLSLLIGKLFKSSYSLSVTK